MKIGFVGLGRMGFNMVLNLLEHNDEVVVYDVIPGPAKKLRRNGAIATCSIKEMVESLPKKKIIWIMVSSKFVDNVLKKLIPLLNKGDIVIDGGNSFYKDSIKRYNKLKKKGISFLDVGTSGGIEGARKGACMMIGGDKKSFKKTENLFRCMCVHNGYGYMGKAGAGHFVKAVHNGIEYGMMSALAEGFNLIEKQKFETDLKEVSKVYANGSIIEGKLSSWLWDSFKKKNFLENISCEVPKGETEDEMKFLEKLGNMPVLHAARMMRVKSRKNSVCGKLISAMRNQFGGHKIIKK